MSRRKGRRYYAAEGQDVWSFDRLSLEAFLRARAAGMEADIDRYGDVLNQRLDGLRRKLNEQCLLVDVTALDRRGFSAALEQLIEFERGALARAS